MPIKACQGCIKDMFITTIEAIDCFTGKQLWGWGGPISTAFSTIGDGTTADRPSPVQTISGGNNWKCATSGTNHSAGIKQDGTLWLWGYGGLGALGNNSAASQVSPVQTISGGQNWKTVSAGGFHTLAIKTDGTLWTWGRNNSGSLGDNTITNKLSPVQTIAAGNDWSSGSAGLELSAAIKTDGTLWLWGVGFCGALGNGAITNRSSPVQTIAGGSNWKQVSAGTYAAAAIKTDGTLWTWGRGNSGELGDNTTVSKSSPVQTIAGGSNWKEVSTGRTVKAAVKTDGTLWTWGYNTRGELGDNTGVAKLSPVQTIAGGSNWRSVSISDHAAAIKTDGTVWTWGYNGRGGLGDNTVANKFSPVQTVALGTSWKQVSSGTTNTTLAIKEVEF